jgi:tetratricopeptide (TPR) repeat protein
MPYCVGCGQTLPEGDRFCVKCGKERVGSGTATNPAARRGSQSLNVVRADDSNFNYSDFGLCERCHAVNLISSACCRSCQTTGAVKRLPGSYFQSVEFWALLVAGIVFLFLPFVSVAVAASLVYRFIRYSSNEMKTRERVRQEAASLFANVKRDQILNACKDVERAITAFNNGMWEESHGLFVNSMMLATSTPEQFLGAAVTAYNLGNYADALQQVERCGEYRTEITHELRARACLRLGDLKLQDMEWLADVCLGFPTKLKHEAAQMVAREWLKAPCLQERIEKLLTLIRIDQPDNACYSEALARYKLLQRRIDDAYAICASLPLNKHKEGSLAIYCDVLRKLNDDSPQTLAVLQRYWDARPDDIDNTLYFASLSIRRKDIGLADAIIRRGLSACPEDHRLRYHLALVLKLAGRLPDCIAELQALLRSPESGAYRSHEDVRLLMAKCLIESGVYDAAVRQLDGINRNNQVLDLLYEIGLKYFEVGNEEKANGCWQEIYAVDVRYKDVATRIHSRSGVAYTGGHGK